MTDRPNNFELPPPPPAGKAHNTRDAGMLIAYIDGLMQEAYEARSPLEAQAQRNHNLHLGNCRQERVAQGVTAVDVNRVRNVDIAHVQVQTESTPRIKLQARESAEPGVAFLDTRTDVGELSLNGQLKDLFAAIPPACYAVGPDGVSVLPLPDALRSKVEDAITLGLVPAEALIVVNDRAQADAKQTVFDAMWEECSADFYVREAAFKKTVIGWQFILYGFDDYGRRHTLFNPSHLQVFIDPLCTDVRDAAHAELLQWVDLYRAKALWPSYSRAFDEAVIPIGGGMDSGNSRTNFPIPEAFKRTQFRRPMVAVRHCWIRDYPFPLTADQAMAAGHVMPPPAAMPAPSPVSTPATPASTMDRGEGAMESTPAEGGAGAVDADEEGSEAAPGYRLTNGGAVTEGDVFAGWPSRPGIREICIVGNTVVCDRESEFGNIPLGHFVDLPIIDSPYGQGQPEALEPLQLAINALLTDFVTHFHYFGTAAVAMPTSVAKRLPGFKEGVYAAPHSEVWEIPDDLITKFGDISKLIGFIEPPALPADFWRFFDLLLSLIDKEGQVTEALQGEGQPQWSGQLAARLQEAARGLIGWKSQRMEHGIEYLARLMLHTIETRLTVDEMARYSSKFPPYVWQYVKSQPSKLDISVEVVSGSGQLREQAKQEAMALWDNGQGPMSETTLLERFGEDPKREQQNKVTEAEEKAKAAQGMAALGAPVQAGTAAPMRAGPGGMNQGAVPAVGAAPQPVPVAA